MGDLSSRLLVHHQLNPINDSRQMNVINNIAIQTFTLLTVGIDNYYSGTSEQDCLVLVLDTLVTIL